MKSRPVFLTLLAAIAAGIIGALLVFNRPAPQPAGLLRVAGIVPPANRPLLAETTSAVALDAVSAKATISAAPVTNHTLPDILLTKSGKPKPAKPPIQDPDARAALNFVGADPAAERYWEAAINDPNLPAEERKDLIEDLNEDGLSDPKNPGPQDVPLILNRIQIIEQLAPNSLDTVNANAFAEAYQDLNNLLAGAPVK